MLMQRRKGAKRFNFILSVLASEREMKNASIYEIIFLKIYRNIKKINQ